MKVYSKSIEDYSINFVTTRELSEFDIRAFNKHSNEEKVLKLCQSTQYKNLFLIKEYNFQFKIKTFSLSETENMYQVVPANQDTMYRIDMLALTDNIVIVGFIEEIK